MVDTIDRFVRDAVGIASATSHAEDEYLHVYDAVLTEGEVDARVLTLAPDVLEEAVTEAFTRAAAGWHGASSDDTIVGIYERGDVPRPWIAVEQIGGRSLDAAQSDLSPVEVGSVVNDVAEALRTASLYNTTHLGLAPSTVWTVLRNGRHAVVGDWGIRRAVRAAAGQPEVTPYTAPEQIEAPGRGSTRTDVYRLAAVTYFALTGTPPVPETSALETAIRAGDVVPPSDVDDSLDAAVDDVVLAALATDPADRPPTSYDFQQRFATAFDPEDDGTTGTAPGSGAGAAVAGTETATRDRPTEGSGDDAPASSDSSGFDRRHALTLLGVGGTALAVGAGWIGYRSAGGSDPSSSSGGGGDAAAATTTQSPGSGGTGGGASGDSSESTTDAPSDGGSGESAGGDSGGGSTEPVTVSFLSAQAAENSRINQVYKDTLVERWEEQTGNTVTLSTASYGDIKNTLSSAVSADNPPTLAESGTLGLEYYLDGRVPDHAPYVEAAEGVPDDVLPANRQTMRYRDGWASWGAPRATTSNFGFRPKIFSQVGVGDPAADLETWSDVWNALRAVQDSAIETIPYEVTGVYNDLESYWGYARTAYTGGTDPWIRGPATDPTVVVGNDGHEDHRRTDGMIELVPTLAGEFSSDRAASRGDEDIPSMMLSGRVASFNYATPTAVRWYAVESDAKIGWHGGDGDFMLLPHPKVDAPFGNTVGISNLNGVTGDHGGHAWTREQAHTLFADQSQAKRQAASDLMTFTYTDRRFTTEAWGEAYAAVPTWGPGVERILDRRGDSLPQNHAKALQNVTDYPDQYLSTGSAWDLEQTGRLRWRDLNETISQTIDGRHRISSTPSLVRERMLSDI